MKYRSTIGLRTPTLRLLTILALMGSAALSACGGGDSRSLIVDNSVGSLHLIDQQVLPRRSEFGGTAVGGLSGIDYDAVNNRYVLVSDDRATTDSANAPRMYFANLNFDVNSFTGVQVLSTFSMKQPDGSTYPKVPDAKVADPESVRFDPATGNLVWLSEGDRTLTSTPTRIINPFVREIRPDGTHVSEYTLPAMFQMSAADVGPRGNLVFEGLTFTPDKSRAVVITEGPLFQDGALPTPSTAAVSRITVFDRASGVANAQYGYLIERVQATPVPADQFTVNGVTEILAVTDTRFLVLERSFSVGVTGNQVRLYEIDISKASNGLGTAALAGASYTLVTKRLVLDFETLKTQFGGIANLEGITFGPRLVNGRQSLVVADDNFPVAASTTDFNQFLVFEVAPQ